MATHSRYLLCSVLTFGAFLAGCAFRSTNVCAGDDAESLGFHEAIEGHRGCSTAFFGGDAVGYQRGWQQGIRRFCTEENGFQQGSQAAALSDACPAALATPYIDGYQSGYSLYLTQLEVDAMERAIETKSADLEQIWSELDAVARKLDETDADSVLRPRLLDASRALTLQQTATSIEIDELEFEVSARKKQLSALQHAFAISD
jgi:hypothetical protein